MMKPEIQATPRDSLTLKWGTLKGWHFETKKCQELVKEYLEIGASMSCATQQDTPEQKALICQIIDASDCDTICLDWDGKDVSKDEAKKYVMEYGQQK